MENQFGKIKRMRSHPKYKLKVMAMLICEALDFDLTPFTSCYHLVVLIYVVEFHVYSLDQKKYHIPIGALLVIMLLRKAAAYVNMYVCMLVCVT